MKKLISTLCFISFSVFLMQANAQSCGTNGPNACTSTGGPANGGFEDPNTTPCAIQGTPYSHAIQFTMFSSFNFQGQQTVDSIEFMSVDNLPCGLCWSVNQVDKRYSANEDGCLRITGTTNDVVGQYKFALALKAWINGQPTGLSIPSSLVDQTGIRLFLRVKSSGGACNNVDTAVAANNNTAAINCPTGIAELSSGVSSLSIVPNPMNSEAVLSFIAEKNAAYTIRITDITGKEVSVKQLEGRAGENKTTIERNNLPAGVYFLSLNDGKNSVTKRFTVTE